MMSLLDLISQNQPHFQTHQALLVIGLQNDFIQPDGKLPVDTRSGFLERIQAVIPKFRQLSANVIWVQTVYEADRIVNDPAREGDTVLVDGLDGLEDSTDDDDDLPKDLIPPTLSRSSRHKQRALDLLKRVSARRRTTPRSTSPSRTEEDDELFLSRNSKRGPACLPDTPGAEFVDQVKPKIELADTVVRTTNYSAFLGTSLLLILRAKLVTELYICGCITNVSVYATVIDAARHGIKINVVEDCLGFRKQSRHDEALKGMVNFIEANVVTSKEILTRDRTEETVAKQKPGSRKSSKDAGNKLEDLVDNLRLSEDQPTNKANANKSPYRGIESPSITINGRHRTLSDASIAESRTTTDTKLSDEQFAERLSQGARASNESSRGPSVAKQNLVKSKIRMRSRGDKGKKREDKDKITRAESNKRGESSSVKGPAEETADRTVKSPKSAAAGPLEQAPRTAMITKAGSSDKLRESPSKREQTLKSSNSQPSLSTSSLEAKEKPSSSLVRITMGRSSKKNKAEFPKAEPQKSPHKPDPETSIAASLSADSPKISNKPQSLATFPTMGPGDHIAEGDSRIIHDFFPPDYRHPTDRSKPLKDLIFHQLYNEVRWQTMHHQQGEVPRLVCCQGEFGADGSMPVYRHPADQALPLLHFSPKVKVIQKQAEKLVGHPLNHVLIQLYRSGEDYISEHSDKTLDIVRGSSIVNVSFGAQRTMRLRTKKSAKGKAIASSDEAGVRNTQRVAMPHNSMFVLGQESNMRWLHGIGRDGRSPAERSEEEKAYSGIRVSLTFRHIGTFLDAESSTIWGQGATSKEQRDAQDVINGDEDETQKIIYAFSRENHETEFDWDAIYGKGFDVLHFRAPPEDLPILFASNNEVENKMVQVFLWENKFNHILAEAPILEKQYELDRQVCYRDNDVNHTEVLIAVPILLYLDHYHPMDRDDRGRSCSSRSYETFVMVSAMLKYWVNRAVPTYYNDFVNMLESLEERYALDPGPFIAGRRFSIGDCSTWPALDELITTWDGWSEEKFPHLTEYYRMLWKKKKSVQKLRESLPEIKRCDMGKDV
ncbi:hypothetical protein K469DRAFT_712511 [Zopfia rhizophila CBS 207.26]|uniref:Fe2OG dioxygenase domain-containing protein n=1 Tax=Zopfia rhizophila CBS 207.26 TaxID=1314779 RepID=A0A6A6EQ76_9PEZI|nr:hypothetical protein K469DRAFT_712511 [Zopfia rhizophila CBS 207.26]